MVIGYSFNDQNINEIILAAADRGQLEMFIIDPLGIGVLDKNASHPIYSGHEFVQRLKPHIIGASRRTLGERRLFKKMLAQEFSRIPLIGRTSYGLGVHSMSKVPFSNTDLSVILIIVTY